MEKPASMKAFDLATFALLVIGGLNWGIVGFTAGRIDLVMGTLGRVAPFLAYLVYAIVGAAAICQIALWKPAHKRLYTHEHAPTS